MTLTTINLAALGDTINLTTEVTGTLPIANGGTNSTATTFVNAASNVTGTLATGNGGTGSTATAFVNAASNVTGTLPAANGGTGVTSYAPGKILQVVTGYLDGLASTTSTTFADTGLDADITLASTSSKVIIQATLVSAYNNALNNQGMFRIMRDDTTNLTPYPDSGEQGHIGIIYCPGEKINSTINFMFEDSPSSTSSLNYSIYFACQTSGSMSINQNGQRSYIHLMEIGA